VLRIDGELAVLVDIAKPAAETNLRQSVREAARVIELRIDCKLAAFVDVTILTGERHQSQSVRELSGGIELWRNR
jgi:hypothetical protein